MMKGTVIAAVASLFASSGWAQGVAQSAGTPDWGVGIEGQR